MANVVRLKQKHTLSCMYMGIYFWEFFGEFYGNSFWKFFWEFFGNFLGIFWEFFGNFWEFLYYKDMFVLTSAMRCDGILPTMLLYLGNFCLVRSKTYAYLY